MNICVTGGTGFIGRHLVQALVRKGHRVKMITRNLKKAKELEEVGMKVAVGDLVDTEFLEKELAGFDVVYHLAAIPGDFWGISQEEYQKINVHYTQNLLAAALHSRVKRFIFCSSIQATRPVTFYGEAKLEAEEEVKRSGLEYVIVRPGFVYGPGETKSFLRLARLVKRGFFPLPRGGKARLSLVFVEDLISLFLKCLDPSAQNKIFLGVGEEVPYSDFIVMVSQELGLSCRVITVPEPLFKTAALFFELISRLTGFHPPFTRRQVDFLNSDWRFKRGSHEVKFWQPKVSLKEGIGETIKWYKENGYL